MELTVVNNTVAPRDNTVELSTLTYQIVGRQPFAAETNRMPSRHSDADLHLNSTALAPSQSPLRFALPPDGGRGVCQQNWPQHQACESVRIIPLSL